MISMRSSARSALKLRDNRVKREQNPRHGHYNGLTHESRETAVAFGRGCGFASGRLLGATGPRMESYNWKGRSQFLLVLGHMKRTQRLLCRGLFSKIEWALLTSIDLLQIDVFSLVGEGRVAPNHK